MCVKKLIFIMLTITASIWNETQASGRASSLMRIERETIVTPLKFYQSRPHNLLTLRAMKNEPIPHHQHFSHKEFFHTYKPHYPNLAFLIKDNEKKRDFFYRCLSTRSNLNLQTDGKKIITDSTSRRREAQALIIGGGQSCLAVAYFLRRHNLKYIILDSENEPGGAWQHGWDLLRLFSPAKWSSLPGWPMPPSDEAYPSKTEVIHYLTEYEKRYDIPIERPVKVRTIRKNKENFVTYTDIGEWESQIVVNATGKWSRPFIPDYPGRYI